MLLHPDGKEEVLVAGGRRLRHRPGRLLRRRVGLLRSHLQHQAGNPESPYRFHQGGADIYKIHVKTRKIVRLTHQEFTPNTGAADWSTDFRTPQPKKASLNYGVLNLGPCPLPGGKVMFVSNRNACIGQAPLTDLAALRHGRRRQQRRVHRPP